MTKKDKQHREWVQHALSRGMKIRDAVMFARYMKKTLEMYKKSLN